ncbi:hypothetical protein NDA03_14120 [Trichocoleus sp. Lan]|uniref:hypothetical protein n=1 Tax=Trichocoleus sp. Lan TaxID=2933927 RepID=UPI003296B96B
MRRNAVVLPHSDRYSVPSSLVMSMSHTFTLGCLTISCLTLWKDSDLFDYQTLQSCRLKSWLNTEIYTEIYVIVTGEAIEEMQHIDQNLKDKRLH